MTPRRSRVEVVGLEALLAEADAIEDAQASMRRARTVSTESEDFARIMDELAFATGDRAPARVDKNAAPLPARGAGDLVAVLGLGSDALTVAREMAGWAGAGAPCSSSPDAGEALVDSRQSALAARAHGVAQGEPVFLAIPLRALPSGQTSGAEVLSSTRPDQLWLAVDAGRKPDDTARWVVSIAASTPVDALAVLGRDTTRTPETVESLGLPIGWAEGRPITRPGRRARGRAAF